MFRLGLVAMLVIHANIEGFGLTPLSGDRFGYLLKTKTNAHFVSFLFYYYRKAYLEIESPAFLETLM